MTDKEYAKTENCIQKTLKDSKLTGTSMDALPGYIKKVTDRKKTTATKAIDQATGKPSEVAPIEAIELFKQCL